MHTVLRDVLAGLDKKYKNDYQASQACGLGINSLYYIRMKRNCRLDTLDRMLSVLGWKLKVEKNEQRD